MEHSRRLARAVRDACIEAAAEAYEDAGMRGLCVEGRWEFAVEAIRKIDLDSLIRQEHDPDGGRSRAG